MQGPDVVTGLTVSRRRHYDLIAGFGNFAYMLSDVFVHILSLDTSFPLSFFENIVDLDPGLVRIRIPLISPSVGSSDIITLVVEIHQLLSTSMDNSEPFDRAGGREIAMSLHVASHTQLSLLPEDEAVHGGTDTVTSNLRVTRYGI